MPAALNAGLRHRGAEREQSVIAEGASDTVTEPPSGLQNSLENSTYDKDKSWRPPDDDFDYGEKDSLARSLLIFMDIWMVPMILLFIIVYVLAASLFSVGGKMS